MCNSAQGKNLICIFQELFASINKVFNLAGGLDTRISFYEVWTLPIAKS